MPVYKGDHSIKVKMAPNAILNTFGRSEILFPWQQEDTDGRQIYIYI